jgi:hypothetical protein
MMPIVLTEQEPVLPPAYHRVQARLGPALYIDALTLVRTLHLLTLCRLAVRLTHRRCPPPLHAGPVGAPRTYSEESLVASSSSFTRPRPPLCGWSAIARQVALIYTASIIVGLAAQQAGRPELIRSRHSRPRSLLGGLTSEEMPS